MADNEHHDHVSLAVVLQVLNGVRDASITATEKEAVQRCIRSCMKLATYVGVLAVTPDELRPILAEYRKRVSAAWSKATAHPDHDAADGSPVGQCGVTSAWLQQRLREDHGIETVYCVGDVVTRAGQPLRDHCWLEMRGGVDRIVIDLTADQMVQADRMIPEAVLVGGHWDLLVRVGHYMTHRRLAAEQSAADPVQARLALLESALS